MNQDIRYWMKVIFIVSIATVVLARWKGAVGVTNAFSNLNVAVIGALKK